MEQVVRFHAEKSASKAHQWLNCPGSVNAQRGLPDDKSEYAEEGTLAHAYADAVFKNDEVSLHALSVSVSSEMAGHVMKYVQDVTELAQGDAIASEFMASIEHITGEKGAVGTADAVVLRADTFEIQIHDLKYGFNPVDAVGNEQMPMYSLAVLDDMDPDGMVYGVETVRMFIHQPRINKTSEWRVSRAELEEWRVKYRQGAVAADDPNAPRIPGDKQCEYCKAKTACPEALARVTTECEGMFELCIDSEDGKKVTIKDDSRVYEFAQHIDYIRMICDAVEKKIFADLLNGKPVPGKKLKLGNKGARKWKDAKEAERLARRLRVKKTDLFEEKMLSPPQLEKVLKDRPEIWERLQKCITQEDPKPVMTSADDPAKEYKPAQIDNLFTNEDDDLIG